MTIIFGLVFGSVVGWIISNAYEKYVTPDEKNRFENWVKLHHGEAGFLGLLLGFLIKSPATMGVGVGLMYHDRKDIPLWFTGDKFRNNSYVPQVTGMA